MTTGIVVLAAIVITLLTVSMGILLALQLRTGRTSALFERQLQQLARRSEESAERQEGLGRLLAEGQARNLDVLQSRFSDAVDTLNRQLAAVTSTLNEQLSQTRGNIGRQLDGTQKVVSQVQERLGELTITARNIQDLGRDIGRLQDILQAPKLRGNLGELFLQDLLTQVLPPEAYESQFAFSSGEKVDAVIRLGDRLVPVDSKFPLESFNRILDAETDDDRKRSRREFLASVRRRIDEISGKYIRTEEGTYDFALMYIPAENVFYEVIIRDDAFGGDRSLFEYSLKKKVFPVSPNSFYAYLASIAYGLRGLQIEERAREIWGQLGHLRNSLERFTEDYQIMGRHLENARSKYGDTETRLAKLHAALEQIGTLEPGDGE